MNKAGIASHYVGTELAIEWEKATRMFKDVEWVKEGTPEAKNAKKLKRGGTHGAYH